MKTEHTRYAVIYVAAMQRELRRAQSNWMDVATAYDAGLRHGAEARGSERSHIERYLKALRIVNSVPRAPAV